MTSRHRVPTYQTLVGTYRRWEVSRGEYRVPAPAKPKPNSRCCRGKWVRTWVPFVRNAKYCRTIKKQERQPHELPFAERARCTPERTQNKNTRNQGFFHSGPSNRLFAKTVRTNLLIGFKLWCYRLLPLQLTPMPSGHWLCLGDKPFIFHS